MWKRQIQGLKDTKKERERGVEREGEREGGEGSRRSSRLGTMSNPLDESSFS